MIAEQQDASSPNYHQWLTPEQYAARFGMSQNDLDRVTTWLEAQGFSGIQVSRSATRVAFDGTAAQVEAAFRTEIHSYLVNGETHFANALEPSVPAAFASTVLGFRRLDNFRPRPRVRPTAHFTSSVSGSHFMTPGDFATIYDLTPLYNLGLDGTGITIAVMGQTLIPLTDDAAFRSAAGLSAKAPTLFLTPNTGTSMTSTNDLNEANLDVEWSGGVAKGATVLYDYAGSTGSVFDALTDAIDNNRAPVIGISYGNCEANIGTPPLTVAQSLRTLVQQGVSQGQTVSAASGDDGAADCEPSPSDPKNTSATTGLAVDVPGAIPEVTSVGGSEFMGDPASLTATQYWGATAGTDDISSALSYIPEMAWNDTATDRRIVRRRGRLKHLFYQAGLADGLDAGRWPARRAGHRAERLRMPMTRTWCARKAAAWSDSEKAPAGTSTPSAVPPSPPRFSPAFWPSSTRPRTPKAWATPIWSSMLWRRALRPRFTTSPPATTWCLAPQAA